MISLTLFKKEFKSNYKLLLIFIGVILMYSTIIVTMFDPALEESLALMAQSMPDLFAAFGMLNVGSTLLEFVTNYLYGFLLIVFPMVFIILSTSNLMAKYIDKGSMAYLLATPNKRNKIALTQVFSLIFYLLILTCFAFASVVVTSEILFKSQLDISSFLIVNIGVFCLYIFMAGLCFMFSCMFDDTKYSIGIGSGILILSVLIQMVSQVGDSFSWLKYLTPLTLFNVNSLILGDGIIQIIILATLGIMMFLIGIIVFSKRDISV